MKPFSQITTATRAGDLQSPPAPVAAVCDRRPTTVCDHQSVPSFAQASAVTDRRYRNAKSPARLGWHPPLVGRCGGGEGEGGVDFTRAIARATAADALNSNTTQLSGPRAGRDARHDPPEAGATRGSRGTPGYCGIRLAFALIAAFLFTASAAFAADAFPPGRISYQGFLTESTGLPLGAAGPTNVTATFRIYRTAGGTTAADVVWAETQIVTVDRGFYSVALGNGTPTGAATDAGKFTNNLTRVFLGADVSERYLGVTVQGSKELSPRVQFMAQPYAQASRAASGVVDPNGNLIIAVSPGGLGINLTNAATATLDVRGTVRATAFQGSGAGVTNVTTTLANLTGTLSGAQIADGAITVAKLVPGTVSGASLANASLETNKLSADAINLILSQAGGVGVGGGVFSLDPANTNLTSLGFVNVGSRRIGGDRWVVKANEFTPNVPQARMSRRGSTEMRMQRTCWTGTKWIVWGGVNANESAFLGTGAMFDPVLNTWTPMSMQNAPSARDEFQTIWVGDRMWLYAGYNGGFPVDGFFYNPTTDQWSQFNTANGPGARARYSAVWTGTEIIVFGGGNASVWLNTGARYNPATDTWRTMASNPQRNGFGDHCFAWTGTEMIIAGGHNTADHTIGITKAARYNPLLDNWTPMPDIPFTVAQSSSVWTGTEYLYGFGHYSDSMRYARYNPVSNTWSAMLTAKPAIDNNGSGRVHHLSVWTGTEWIISGGNDGASNRFEGARFNPVTGRWTPIPNIPKTTTYMNFTWTGRELLVFADWVNDSDVSVIGYQPPIEAYQYVKQ